jgi:uncharacterized protein
MPTAQFSHALIADFDIVINGTPLPSEEEVRIVEIIVDLDHAIPSMFSITFAGSSNRQDDLTWLDNQRFFSIGNSVEVRLGYDKKLETVIEGEITGLEPEFAANQAPHLVVRGYDRRHRLQRGQKIRSFTKVKDSDIAQTIAAEAGLTAKVVHSKITHDYLLQSNQTDLAFLQQRATLIHYELFVEGKKLFFRPVSSHQSETLSLDFEADQLLTFYPRLSSMNQATSFVVQGWNPSTKQPIQVKAPDVFDSMGGKSTATKFTKQSFGEATVRTLDASISNLEEAQQIAVAHGKRSSLGLITGEGSCFGRTDLKPNQVVQLQGLGKRFSGKYYVTAVKHHLRLDQGYITTFTVQRSGI